MALLPASTPAQRPGEVALALPPAAKAELDSRDLMRGGREVLIHHAGQVYRLRHTRNDKLILVK